jgi:hypothetical protein
VGQDEVGFDLQQAAEQLVAAGPLDGHRERLDHPVVEGGDALDLAADVHEGPLDLAGQDRPDEVVARGEPAVQRRAAVAGLPGDVVHAQPPDAERRHLLPPGLEQSRGDLVLRLAGRPRVGSGVEDRGSIVGPHVRQPYQ